MNLQLDPLPLLYSQTPWEDRFAEALAPCGFGDAKKAWNVLLTLAKPLDFAALFSGFFPAFLEKLAQSYDADLALSNFERFAGKIFDQNYFYILLNESPDLLHALVTLFSGSQVLTDTLLKEPGHFDWLKNPDVLNESRSKDALMRDFYEMAGGDTLDAQTPAHLRRFKKREYIRIGLRDLLGKAEMLETVRDISNLADVCLQIAYELADKECKQKYGAPMYQDPEGNWLESEFTILGMGKLGGQELNFSSDIDLIYIYTSSMGETRSETGGEDGGIRLSNHEYFTKLAQKLTQALHEITPEGNVFRVDLDLRPEGRSGEIANSLASCEVYYQSWGRTWERQALLKARICAGSIALGKEFFTLLEPFIYRRHLDFSAIEEIKAMKEKINASLKGKKSGKGNIKLGFGGIREIEFIVQAYLLIFGGRQPGLRVKNTLGLLKKLRDEKYLSPEDHDNLKAAYIFLRNLENRVQISFGLQTHMLPEDERKLAVLARKMGVHAGTPQEQGQALLEQFEQHTKRVGTMFAGLFADEEEREAKQKVEGSASAVRMELSEELLSERGFTEPKQALRFLHSLRDGPQFSHPSEKSIQDFYACLPRILDHCERIPKPNAAVENLVKFVEASRARDSYLNLFRSNDKVLELFLILFGSSDYLSNTLVKQPGLVDVLMDLEAIYRYKPPEKIAEDLNRNLRGVQDFTACKNALRRFKQGEELRIGLRFLIHESDLTGTLNDLSALAEVYLKTVTQLAYEELQKRSGGEAPLPDDFAIFGLGKLGGGELNFGSDLDIVYVFDEPEEQNADFPKEKLMDHYVGWCQLIHQLTAERTEAGIAYELDTDLRPDGSRGTLAHSVQGYEDYFKNRARIWERQAMLRLRFIAGSQKLGETFLDKAHAFTYGEKLDYGSLIEISRLRERMEKELARESRKGKNVKLGFGGIVDIEFAVQIMQLMHGKQNHGLRLTPTLDVLKQLGAYGMLDQQEVEQIRKHYLFLRTLECALRIQNDPSTNHLPKDAQGLAPLGKLLGYGDSEADRIGERLVADYDATTKQVRAFYRKLIDKFLRTAL